MAATVFCLQTQYLERMKLKEADAAPEKKEEPVPFFKPTEEFLKLVRRFAVAASHGVCIWNSRNFNWSWNSQQEEAEAANNPDHDRVINVGAKTKKTGIVRDKRGNIIGATDDAAWAIVVSAWLWSLPVSLKELWCNVSNPNVRCCMCTCACLRGWTRHNLCGRCHPRQDRPTDWGHGRGQDAGGPHERASAGWLLRQDRVVIAVHDGRE